MTTEFTKVMTAMLFKGAAEDCVRPDYGIRGGSSPRTWEKHMLWSFGLLEGTEALTKSLKEYPLALSLQSLAVCPKG